MESRKAKIEKFFGSNENLRAIANNKEFIEKVAGGQATPETYQKELGKLGLELTREEAQEIQTITDNAMNISPKELDQATLESIAGGLGSDPDGAVVTAASGALTPVAALASIACGIAGTVYYVKTQEALRYDHLPNAKKFHAIAGRLLGASVGLGAGAIASGALFVSKVAAAAEAAPSQKQNHIQTPPPSYSSHMSQYPPHW